MTQEYTPVAWQDETTSQQGTLINAERLNQMQTAHHFADGLEEVDAIPTADPGVSYHKIVYCTADSTIYRWDGTEWTKDIDDETKALLQQEIARATAAEGELAQSIEDETTARETADSAMQEAISDLGDAIEAEETARGQADTALGTRITNETSARETADTALGNRITAEATARAEADTALGGRIDTEQARAEAAEQANAQAIANTYTKAEIDTALAGKASTSTVQTLDTRVGALETGLADTYNKSQTDTLLASKANDSAVVHLAGAETIPGPKTFTAAINAQSTLPTLNLQNTFGVTSSTPSSNYWDAIYFKDKNGANEGLISFAHYTSGNKDLFLQLNAENGAEKYFHLFANNDGTAYMTAPTRGYNPSYVNDVATIGTLDAYLPMVRTSGNQTIAGTKVITNINGNAVKNGTGSEQFFIFAKLNNYVRDTARYTFILTSRDPFETGLYSVWAQDSNTLAVLSSSNVKAKFKIVTNGTYYYFAVGMVTNNIKRITFIDQMDAFDRPLPSMDFTPYPITTETDVQVSS
jgi:hypothetical protein